MHLELLLERHMGRIGAESLKSGVALEDGDLDHVHPLNRFLFGALFGAIGIQPHLPEKNARLAAPAGFVEILKALKKLSNRFLRSMHVECLVHGVHERFVCQLPLLWRTEFHSNPNRALLKERCNCLYNCLRKRRVSYQK